MLVETVKVKDTKKVEHALKRSSSKNKKSRSSSSRAQIIIYSIVIILIFSYIAYDIFFAKSNADKKAVIVNEKLDSLEINMSKKFIDIDKASNVQQKQLEELKNIVKNN